MGGDSVRAKIEAWKLQAELYLKENKEVFIKNFNHDYFFGAILLVGEDYITIDCNAPEKRKGHQMIPWVSIMMFDERRWEGQ